MYDDGVCHTPLGRFPTLSKTPQFWNSVGAKKKVRAANISPRAFRRRIVRDFGTLLIVEQSRLENRPEGGGDTHRRRIRYHGSPLQKHISDDSCFFHHQLALLVVKQRSGCVIHLVDLPSASSRATERKSVPLEGRVTVFATTAEYPTRRTLWVYW